MNRSLSHWWGRVLVFILLTAAFYYGLSPFDLTVYFNAAVLFISLLIATILVESGRIGGKIMHTGLHFDKFTLPLFLKGFLLALIPIISIGLLSWLFGGRLILNRNFAWDDGYSFLTYFYFLNAAEEELIFRGIIFQAIISKFNPWLVSFIFSALFSIAHMFNPEIGYIAYINIFLSGLIFCLMYIRTLSLILPISFHFFWNWLQFILLSKPISGIYFAPGIFSLYVPENPFTIFIFGDNFGIESGFAVTLSMIIILLIMNKIADADPYISSSLFKRRVKEAELTSY
ncbi:MAG: CPBP family intramembrane glutamic endopeptidase [Candidatus Kapaibacterium sp.]